MATTSVAPTSRRCHTTGTRSRHSAGGTISIKTMRPMAIKACRQRDTNPAGTPVHTGHAQTKSWVLDLEQASPKAVEPLMGWTSSSDMRQQVRLRFDSKDEAIAYCERNGIPYRVFDANPPKRRIMAYADNFAYSRRVPWTH